MQEEKKKVVDIKELGLSGGDFDLPLLSELAGKEIVIREIRFGEGKFGKYAVVKLDSGEEYRTTSEVVMKQLEKMQQVLQDSMVKARVKKVRNYYILD